MSTDIIDVTSEAVLSPELQERHIFREILTRLTGSLNYAVSALDAKEAVKYHVLDIPDDGPPVDFVYDNIDQVGAHITERRLLMQRLQQECPDRTFYIRIYSGDRIRIRKGLHWKLDTGKELISITGNTAAVADDDSISESVNPDVVIAQQAVATAQPVQQLPANQPSQNPNLPLPGADDEEILADDGEPIIE